MKIIMTIPVKNHKYLIRQNIEYHYYKEKVDGFVIYAHNSTDGTYEIVEELSKKIPIKLIIITEPAFLDSVFRTQMAEIAKKTMNADWIISNDVDEFVCTKEQNLHKILKEASVKIIYSYRYNTLPYVEKNKVYKSPPESFNYAITLPKKLDKSLPYSQISALDYLIKTNAGKAICNTKGLINIGHGAHEITHENNQTTIDTRLVILHYPFSTKEIFLKETEDKIKSVFADKSLKPDQNWHVKYMQYLVEEKKLDNFADQIFVNEIEFNKLLKNKIIEKIPYVYDYFNQ